MPDSFAGSNAQKIVLPGKSWLPPAGLPAKAPRCLCQCDAPIPASPDCLAAPEGAVHPLHRLSEIPHDTAVRLPMFPYNYCNPGEPPCLPACSLPIPPHPRKQYPTEYFQGKLPYPVADRPSQSKSHPRVLPGSFAVLSFRSPGYFQRQPHFECDSLKHSAVSGLEIYQSSTMIAPDQPSSDDAHKDHYLLPARADPAHLPLGKDKEAFSEVFYNFRHK